MFTEHQTVGKDNSPLLVLNATGLDRGAKVSVLGKIRICKSSRETMGELQSKPNCVGTQSMTRVVHTGWRREPWSDTTHFPRVFLKLESECSATIQRA